MDANGVAAPAQIGYHTLFEPPLEMHLAQTGSPWVEGAVEVGRMQGGHLNRGLKVKSKVATAEEQDQ